MIELEINSQRHRIDAPPLRRLLDALREDLGLTGTKEGCGEGECGACTVLIDGEAVNSCLVPVCQVEAGQGHRITTIEATGHEIEQEAFLATGGAQCGICTPGMILATRTFLDRELAAGRTIDADAVRQALAGNLCRCTGYGKIVEAALLAASTRSEETAP